MIRQAEKNMWKDLPKIRAEDIPSFHLTFPDAADSLRSALDDLLILLILNVVFFMLGFMFFLRYDVR